MDINIDIDELFESLFEKRKCPYRFDRDHGRNCDVCYGKIEYYYNKKAIDLLDKFILDRIGRAEHYKDII